MKDKILYAKAVYDDAEKQAVLRSLENSWLVDGIKVREFERKTAKLFRAKYAIALNSGSSANLLALASLQIPEGSEVITPACTFATTVAPIIQNKLKPVFVDSVIGRYTINESLIEKAITRKTRALMIPQLIGGVCDMKKLRDIALKYNLYLINDSCDSISPSFEGKSCALYSDITTTSFYGSHMITTMGSGGMIFTDSKIFVERIRALSNWGRIFLTNEKFEERFNYEIDNIPYDEKFLYSQIGYNLKMTEAQAAFGLEQLKKLPKFLQIRQQNFQKLLSYFGMYEKYFYLPELLPKATTTWLAFPLTVRDEAPFKRYDFLKHLDKNSVQVRVLFSGNVIRHPAYLNKGNFSNADYIMRGGLLIGAHHGMTSEDTDRLIRICEEFLCLQP